MKMDRGWHIAPVFDPTLVVGGVFDSPRASAFSSCLVRFGGLAAFLHLAAYGHF